MSKTNSPAKLVLIIAAILTVVSVTIAGAIFAANSLSDDEISKCDKAGTVHKVEIKDDKVIPKHTEAKLCDQLKIVNNDDQERLMAFGQHDRHIAYDGTEEKLVRQGQSLSVELNQAGTYKFHDHEDESVGGTFTVK